MSKITIKREHKAVNAFWEHWEGQENADGKGTYEATLGAIDAALSIAGVVYHPVVSINEDG